MDLGIFDLFTVGVALVGYVLGRNRGLIWQLSGIGTLIVGGLSATVLSIPLGGLFAEGILGRFAAWVVVYAIVAVCLYVITLKLQRRIEELEYKELDKRFGGLLGALKGLLAFSVLTLIAVSVFQPIEKAVKSSASGGAMRYLVHEMRPLLPERVHDAFGPYLDRVDLEHPAPQAPPPQLPAPAPSKAPGPSQVEAPGEAPIFAGEVPREQVRVPEESAPVAEEPRAEGPDPFDTSQDPPDPLAPRSGK